MPYVFVELEFVFERWGTETVEIVIEVPSFFAIITGTGKARMRLEANFRLQPDGVDGTRNLLAGSVLREEGAVAIVVDWFGYRCRSQRNELVWAL
jgi:hypothetical protein